MSRKASSSSNGGRSSSISSSSSSSSSSCCCCCRCDVHENIASNQQTQDPSKGSAQPVSMDAPRNRKPNTNEGRGHPSYTAEGPDEDCRPARELNDNRRF